MHPRGRGIMQDDRSLSKFSAHHADGHGSCERLVERAAAGDRLAMQILYARHHVRVYRFALRFVNDAAAAEDLTSEVFLEVWKHAGRFEGRSQVSTWLLSIARYKALAALRRRTNHPLDNAVLRQCLTQLSPAHREIIDLVYYHEKSVAEVAEIIGAPQNTVKTRMFHARKRIAALLDARGFDAAA